MCVLDARLISRGLQQLGKAVPRERAAFGHEHVFVRLPVAAQGAQRPQVVAHQRLEEKKADRREIGRGEGKVCV